MASQEHVDLLTQGVEAWNQWKGDTHETTPDPRWKLCYDADLSDADLSGADLNGINLGKVDLARANFAGAYLIEACLAESEFVEANFAGARLDGANLSGAHLWAANFSNADLRNADLSGADLSEACFQGADLSGANLSRADLSEARLQGANLSGANFNGVYSGSSLLEAYLHRAEIRRAKEAGAVMHQTHIERQGAEGYTKVPFKKKAQNQDIVLSMRTNSRLLRLIGLSLLFVIGGVWMLHSPGNLVQVVMGILAVLFFGLGAVIFLFQFLRLLFRRIPLLIINDEGIQYFHPFMLEVVEKNIIPYQNIMLKWKEIGAIGFITMEQTNSFALYASAKRWRSGWCPSIRLPQSLLPIAAKQLIALIQDHYQMQIEAYHIETVEIEDAFSLSRKRKKV
jgi:hypothetical protein